MISRQMKYYNSNSEEIKRKARAKYIYKVYGISLEQYEEDIKTVKGRKILAKLRSIDK